MGFIGSSDHTRCTTATDSENRRVDHNYPYRALGNHDAIECNDTLECEISAPASRLPSEFVLA
jgi:hypothetical protein